MLHTRWSTEVWAQVRVEFERAQVSGAVQPYERGELDVVTVRYTPRLADIVTEAHGPVELLL